MGRSIDEKHGLGDVVFLGHFLQEDLCEAVVVVENSRVWRILFVSGSTAAYSQYC